MIETLFPPVPADDEVERAARSRALVALREETTRDICRVKGTVPFVRQVSRFRWFVVPALVAGVAAAVVALTSGVDEGRVSPPAASAAALLTRAAEAAETAPAPGALAPGQYLYVKRTAMEPKTITRSGETFTVFIRYVDEDWTRRDGAGRSRHRLVPPAFPTEKDRAAWERAGSPSQRKMLGNYMPILEGSDHSDGGRPGRAFPARSTMAMSYRAVRALPRDPAALEAKLRAQLRAARTYTPGSRDLMLRMQLLERVGQLLAGTPLDAAQRAALFRVAAGIEGVTVSGDALDLLGRKGTAVKLEGTIELDGKVRPEYEGVRVRRGAVIVFDPGTGALLGTRHTLNDDVDQGAVYTTQVRDALK